MLFSEPKIPQSKPRCRCCAGCLVSVLFSEPKIPQRRSAACCAGCLVSVLFSEPKIPQQATRCECDDLQRFQCSSASRKFLNICWLRCRRIASMFGFSALQRAENSSILIKRRRDVVTAKVSVLFSEPKIPQSLKFAVVAAQVHRFSALQRAENSSI